MKVLFEQKQCPKCKKQIVRDNETGPGKWYWCDNCKRYTIQPRRETR